VSVSSPAASRSINLREIIDHIDELRFRSQTEKHELSHLYEAKIKNMGNAGRNGGEYYTPRPLIRAIVQVVKPKIGERIYDGAVGSAGFLCESFEYMKSKGHLTTKDLATLQTRTFYGKEKKSLAYVIAIMNMILHGIEAPNIIHTNTLTENLADIQEKDRYDVVLANPPFGGNERKEVQQNFPIRTGETAFLFLQHFIKILKAGGRGGIVIKNTFLSNTDNASVSLRKLLLESCNLHTVLDCPGGTFQGAGVKTVVLLFDKGAPTREVWYYQLDPGRNLGKTNPLSYAPPRPAVPPSWPRLAFWLRSSPGCFATLTSPVKAARLTRQFRRECRLRPSPASPVLRCVSMRSIA
jgi:type I restriction enzyme M protein